MSFDLSVIIPCYNEGYRLKAFFDLIRDNPLLLWEWIFVDDGSTDNTSAKIRDFIAINSASIRLIVFDSNHGKGKAVREGILASKGKIVGFVDADLAASPLHFRKFLCSEHLINGEEVVIGIRLKTQSYKVNRAFHRHLIGRVFQTYVSIMTGINVYDSQCGFKLIASTQAKKIAKLMKCNGFAFDVELISIALSMHMKVREELIPWEEKGNTSIRINHVFRMMVDIWKIGSRNTRFARRI